MFGTNARRQLLALSLVWSSPESDKAQVETVNCGDQRLFDIGLISSKKIDLSIVATMGSFDSSRSSKNMQVGILI